MRPWVSIHVELLRDARFMRLAPAVRCAWYEMLMEAASEEGILPALDEWAWRWRVAPEELAELLEWYLQEGWLLMAEGGFVVAKWEKYQKPLKKDTGAADRMQRYRDRLRNAEPVTRNVTRNEGRNEDRNAVTLRCPTGEERIGEDREKSPTIVGVAPEDSGPRVVGKRDKAIALYWDLFRFLFSRRARDVTFWGRTALSDKYRRRAKNLVATLGNDAYKGLLGNRLNPYWQDKATGVVSFSLENALSEKASANGLRYYNQNVASCERLKEEFNEWIRQPGNDSTRMGADATGGERGEAQGGTVPGAAPEGDRGLCREA